MPNPFLVSGSVYGLLAVMLGAFGAHALRAKLSANLMSSYETAVQYQLVHALALLLVGALAYQMPASRSLQVGGWFFIAGVALFSGSLYLLSLTGLRQLGNFNIGLVTPMGGICLIIGWLLLCLAFLRS